jgi:uncharacterized membrane protein YfhO
MRRTAGKVGSLHRRRHIHIHSISIEISCCLDLWILQTFPGEVLRRGAQWLTALFLLVGKSSTDKYVSILDFVLPVLLIVVLDLHNG